MHTCLHQPFPSKNLPCQVPIVLHLFLLFNQTMVAGVVIARVTGLAQLMTASSYRLGECSSLSTNIYLQGSSFSFFSLDWKSNRGDREEGTMWKGGMCWAEILESERSRGWCIISLTGQHLAFYHGYWRSWASPDGWLGRQSSPLLPVIQQSNCHNLL